jgi:starch synthase
LADTVSDGETGFAFDAFSTEAFAGATGRALACWQNPAAWQRMMRVAMQRDFSWREPMARYFEAYDTTGAAT